MDKTLAGFKKNSNLLFGLNNKENNGLKLDESNKRRREDTNGSGIMDVDLGLIPSGPQRIKNNMEADISQW